jgi:hypothetical protein
VTALHAELEAIVGAGALLTDPVDLLAYGFDGTFFDSSPPLVVLPGTADQVAAIHRVAAQRKIPITPRAMGSGLSGGSVPLGGSIVLGVARMNRVIAIDPIDRVAVVEPGVITAQLQALVERQSLFYPPDPSSIRQSAIGGNVAENAGGARGLKYGVTGDYVLALQVVLPDGTIIRTGGNYEDIVSALITRAGSRSRVMRPKPSGCGPRAGRSRRRWRAAGRTNSAKTSPCRGDPFRRWSAGCAKSPRNTNSRSRSSAISATATYTPTFFAIKRTPPRWSGSRPRRAKSSRPRWGWAGRSRANTGSVCSRNSFLNSIWAPTLSRSCAASKPPSTPDGLMNPGKIFPDPGGIDAFHL